MTPQPGLPNAPRPVPPGDVPTPTSIGIKETAGSARPAGMPMVPVAGQRVHTAQHRDVTPLVKDMDRSELEARVHVAESRAEQLINAMRVVVRELDAHRAGSALARAKHELLIADAWEPLT